MIGKSYHEIEIELDRRITDDEFKTVIHSPHYRSIVIENKTYEFYDEGWVKP